MFALEMGNALFANRMTNNDTRQRFVRHPRINIYSSERFVWIRNSLLYSYIVQRWAKQECVDSSKREIFSRVASSRNSIVSAFTINFSLNVELKT